jgi:hypothetical protein
MVAIVSVRLHGILEERCARGLSLKREADRLFEIPRLSRATRNARPGKRFPSEACTFCSKHGPLQIRTKIAGEPCNFCCVRCLAAFENDEDEPADPCTYCGANSIASANG